MNQSLLNYLPEIEKIKLLQLKTKEFLNKRNILLRGPGIYNRKLCNNQEDFYTFEPVEEIPLDNFFSFRDKDNFVFLRKRQYKRMFFIGNCFQ